LVRSPGDSPFGEKVPKITEGSGNFPSHIWARKWIDGDLNKRQRTWERESVDSSQSSYQSVDYALVDYLIVDYCDIKPNREAFTTTMKTIIPRKDIGEFMPKPRVAEKVRDPNAHRFNRINEDSSNSSGSSSDSGSESDVSDWDEEPRKTPQPTTVSKEKPPSQPVAATSSRSSSRSATRQWVSAKTKKAMDLAVETSIRNNKCIDCGFTGETKRIRILTKQHYVVYWCQCGYFSCSRDQVKNHQKRLQKQDSVAEHGETAGDIYEVDRDTFKEWSREVNLTKVKKFPNCKPREGIDDSDKENNPPDADLRAIIRRRKRSTTTSDNVVTETTVNESTSTARSNKRRLLTSLRANIADLEMQAEASKRQAQRLQQ
jgi:hypothetical protein